MPALFPTFQLAAYFGNEATIGPGGKVLEQYSVSGAGGYGYYENVPANGSFPSDYTGPGMVMNSPYYPDVYQHDQIEYVISGNEWLTAGPRTIICTQNLGDTTEITVYAYADYHDRLTSSPTGFEQDKLGTNFGTTDSLPAARTEGTTGLGMALFDFRQAVQNLFLAGETTSPATNKFDVIDHGTTFFEFWDLQVGVPPGVEDYPDDYGRPTAFQFKLGRAVPTQNLALWVGAVGWTTGRRIVVTGFKINGVLYGVDDQGNDGTDSEYTDLEGEPPYWWQDLQNCTQGGITVGGGVGNYRGPYVDGYNEGYYSISQDWNFFRDGNIVSWPPYIELTLRRDSWSVGARQGLFDATDEGGIPYALPDPATEAAAFGESHARWDAYFDGVRLGLVSSPEMVSIGNNGRPYTDPASYVDTATYGTTYVAVYNGFYNGAFDAITASDASAAYDSATGQVGTDTYNAAYLTAYNEAWVEMGETIPATDYTGLGFYAAYALAFDDLENDIPELPANSSSAFYESNWTPYYATYYGFDDRYDNQDSPIVGEFGAWFGWDDKIDQLASPPVSGYTSQDAIRGAAYGLKFGIEDARFDLSQFPAPYGKTYTNPATYTGLNDATTFALVAAQAYNGAYNGWTDGYNDDQAANPNDPTGGYTGNSDYNTAYNTAYLDAYPDGG
ncbi:MAG: hypothetical protein P1U54_14870 [Immundisolibacteraceae bacterium]|nr:hypothetical protein [Immundisolibacteraceae bacterium]